MGKEQKINRETMTVNEVAEALGVSPKHIYKLIKAKRLPRLKVIGPIRVSKSALHRITGLEKNED